MASLNLERMIFDPLDAADSSNVGAYLRDSAGALLTSTLVGSKQSLDVHLAASSDAGYFAEDVASTNADIGQSVLAVYQATLASSVSTDGDYGWFKLNTRGALWVAPVGTVADNVTDTENPVKVGSRALSGALTTVTSGTRADVLSDVYRRVYINDSPNIASACGKVTIGATEVALPTSALAGRRRMMIQNISSNDVFVGPTGVAITGATTGIKISKGSTLSLEIGQNVALVGISGTAGNDVVVFELA